MKQKVFNFNRIIVVMTWGVDPEDSNRCYTKYFRLSYSGIYEEVTNWLEIEHDTAAIISANCLDFCNTHGLINWSY